MIPKLKIVYTNATEVCVNGITLYFSYETCVAFSGPSGNYKTATKNSKTTSKHKTLMGVNSFTELEESVFAKRLAEEFNGEFL
jgi:hypothetical protein